MLGSKFTKFLSFFRQQISFSSNFASIFSIMRHNSSVFFLAETLYTFNKRSLSKYKFGEISPEQLKFFWKSYKVPVKKVQKRNLSWHWRSDARFKEKLTCGFKYDINDLVNFHPTILKSTNFTLMGYFCPKYMRFGLKKYRGVIIHDPEQWCKIWIKLDLVVSKMAWGIRWTLIRALKVLKNCTLMGSFCPKYMFQLENLREILCHGTEGWW